MKSALIVLFVCYLGNALSLPRITPKTQNNLTLTVVHFNDFHARFDEQSPTSAVCKPNEHDCHGGFARMYQAIQDAFKTSVNPILLNAGDNFQGTMWYNLFKWNVTQYFLNMLPTTAHTVGNHEFDDHVAGLVPFLKAMKAPTVICNIDDSLVPEFRNTYKKSIVIEIDNRKIGIVGVATRSTKEISRPDDLIFLDESTSVNAEVDRLVREEDIFTAIVLSHAGYETDIKIAKAATKKVGLIVGGHSHTFLNNGPGEDGSIPMGPYPTLVSRDVDRKLVPIVQAYAYTRYLGKLKVSFDANGDAISWSGSPIYLSPKLPKNPEIEELLKPWKEAVDNAGKKVLGSTDVYLQQETCRYLECNLGNLVTDTMVYAYKDKAVGNAWTYASLAIINSGGIRASISIGNITYNDLITAQPFGNTFDVGLLKGKYIRQFLERAATAFNFRDPGANVQLLQLSGFRVVYDLSKPEYQRIVDVKVLCADCPKPKYEQLDVDKDYKLIVASYVADGGDGFTMISDNLRNRTEGEKDIDVFTRYFPMISPIKTGIEGRITFVGPTAPA